MYKIAETEYGFRITISGVVDVSEAEQVAMELLEKLSAYDKQFSLIADLRGLVPFEPEAMKKIQQTQIILRQMSLLRSAIITNSPILMAQGKQNTFKADTANIERFIDASKVDDWEEQALAWILNGVEPVQESRNITHTQS